MTKIDARGKACPIPVILSKKEVDSGNRNFSILVDNQTAVENLKRFGNSNGLELSISGTAPDYEVVFQDGEVAACEHGCELMEEEYNSWAVFVGKQGVGDGDLELGASLLKMFFYTLAQDKDIPTYILFMNDGAKVPVTNDQVVEQLIALKELGSDILVCGTCLDYYGIKDQLQIGTVSNMYDIASAMKSVNKVIAL
jgi:selenium metabolism protein YedF